MDLQLFVLETSGLDRRGSTVTSGVPFPEGTVQDPGRLTLWDEREDPIPVQCTVLNRWPDGSIRWVLLDFRVDVDADQERDLMLTDTYPVPALADVSCVRSRNRGDRLVLDTSALRFNIPKNLSAPLEEVSLGRGGKVGLLRGPEMRIAVSSSMHRPVPAVMRPPDRVEVERCGAEHEVVFRSGIVSLGSGEPLFRYDQRIHVLAGNTGIHMELSLTQISRYPLLFVREWALECEFPSCCVGDYVFGGSAKPHKGDFEETETRYLIPAEAHGWKLATLLQEDDASYRVCHSHHQGMESGTLAPGWVDLTGVEFGVCVAVRDFWQQYPKSLCVRGDGGVEIGLWPIQAMEPCRFERGAARTYEVLYYFHAEDAEYSEYETAVADFHDPLMAVASPSWYAESGAFGEIAPFDPLAFPERDTPAKLGTQRPQADPPFGPRVYGLRGRPGTEREAPEGDLVLSDLYQFIRTGSRSFLRQARVSAAHEADLHTNHVTGEYLLMGPLHTTLAPAMSHVNVRGLVTLSLLTGERRFWETAQCIGAWVREEAEAPLYYFETDRAIGCALITLNHLYRESDNASYLQAAAGLAHRVVQARSETGAFGYKPGENQEMADAGLAALGLVGFADLAKGKESAEAAEAAQEYVQQLADRSAEAGVNAIPILVWAYRSLAEPRFLESARLIYSRLAVSDRKGISHLVQPYMACVNEKRGEPSFQLDSPIDVSRFCQKTGLHRASLAGRDSIWLFWQEETGLELVVQRIGGKSEGLATLSTIEGREVLSRDFPPPEKGFSHQEVLHFSSNKPAAYLLEVESEKEDDLSVWQVWSGKPFQWVRHAPEHEVVAPYFGIPPDQEWLRVRLEALKGGYRQAILFDSEDRVVATVGNNRFHEPGEVGEISVPVNPGSSHKGPWCLILRGLRAWVPEALPYFAFTREALFFPEQ